MDQDFHCGDRVNLMMDQAIVALGTICAIRPTDTCHGQVLGNGFLLVSINNCLNDIACLPFPNKNAQECNKGH